MFLCLILTFLSKKDLILNRLNNITVFHFKYLDFYNISTIARSFDQMPSANVRYMFLIYNSRISTSHSKWIAIKLSIYFASTFRLAFHLWY